MARRRPVAVHVVPRHWHRDRAHAAVPAGRSRATSTCRTSGTSSARSRAGRSGNGQPLGLDPRRRGAVHAPRGARRVRPRGGLRARASAIVFVHSRLARAGARAATSSRSQTIPIVALAPIIVVGAAGRLVSGSRSSRRYLTFFPVTDRRDPRPARRRPAGVRADALVRGGAADRSCWKLRLPASLPVPVRGASRSRRPRRSSGRSSASCPSGIPRGARRARSCNCNAVLHARARRTCGRRSSSRPVLGCSRSSASSVLAETLLTLRTATGRSRRVTHDRPARAGATGPAPAGRPPRRRREGRSATAPGARSRRSGTSTCRSAAASSSRSSGRPAAASRRCSGSSATSTSPTAGTVDGQRQAGAAGPPRPRLRHGLPGAGPVRLADGPEERRAAARDHRAVDRASGRAKARAMLELVELERLRAATSRGSCRAACSSASRSRGRSPSTRRSCSWTSRSARSTR